MIRIDIDPITPEDLKKRERFLKPYQKGNEKAKKKEEDFANYCQDKINEIEKQSGRDLVFLIIGCIVFLLLFLLSLTFI